MAKNFEIQIRSRTWLPVKKLRNVVVESTDDRLFKAATKVEGHAKRSMTGGGKGRGVGKGKPSIAPMPPHRQSGNLANSIKVEKLAISHYVIGPTRFIAYAQIHEFGGIIKVKGIVIHMPARPYMRPALIAILNEFPQLFRNMNFKSTKANKILQQALTQKGF